MPLSSTFESYPLVAQARRVRKNPLAAYSLAIGAVVVATLVRRVVGGYAMDGTPFITYYPAIIVAAIYGGFWPGLFSAVLSGLLAWALFIPPEFSFALGSRELVSLLLFLVISVINVVLVALLNGAIERILSQEKNVRVLIESAPNGIVVVDEEGTIRLVNQSTERLFGYRRAEILGKSVEVLVPESDAPKHRTLRSAYQKAPTTRVMGAGRDLEGKRKDGSQFPVEIGLNVVSGNGASAVLATVIDISERRRLQENQRLIVRELQHRTKNLFAVFQAVAARTVDENRTSAEIKSVLNDRIQALARAYDALADGAWEGVSLAVLLQEELDGFGGRVKVTGCDIVINPAAAQQFALIIHELATNAVKYGALSTPAGLVSIAGTVDRSNGAGAFSFAWHEAGGPTVAPPARRGFGSVILLDAARQFGEGVAMEFAPQGLTYELRLTLAAIEPSVRTSRVRIATNVA